MRTHSLETPSTSPAETPSTIGSVSTSEHEEQDLNPDQDRSYYAAHGRFAGEVTAAIDVRAGLAPAATSNRIPFVDAPLFGEIDLHSSHSVLAFAGELPPRAHAEKLVGIYW